MTATRKSIKEKGTMGYSRPQELTLKGDAITEIEVSTGDSVRITKKDGTFILISPGNRDMRKPDEDLLIEVFPCGIQSMGGGQ